MCSDEYRLQLQRIIEQQTGVHAMTIRDALTAAVIGTGKYAEVMG